MPTKRAKIREIYLPDDDPAAFDLLVRWFYRNTLADVNSSEMADQYPKLYILGDKYLIEALKSEVIKGMKTFTDANRLTTSVATIKHAYENTTAASPMRKYLTQVWAQDIYDSGVLRASTSGEKMKLKNGMLDLMKKNGELAVDGLVAVDEHATAKRPSTSYSRY